MKPIQIYRQLANHYRMWKIAFFSGAVIWVIAGIACLMLQHAALAIAFACAAVLFTFIAATLRQDHMIYQGLADYYDEAEIHDQIEL